MNHLCQKTQIFKEYFKPRHIFKKLYSFSILAIYINYFFKGKCAFQNVSHPHQPLRLIACLNVHLAPGRVLFPLPGDCDVAGSFQDTGNDPIVRARCLGEGSVMIILSPWIYSLALQVEVSEQQFSTGVPQEIVKQARPDCLVRGTDLFSLRLSNRKMTTANTTLAVQCEGIKIISIFCQVGKK